MNKQWAASIRKMVSPFLTKQDGRLRIDEFVVTGLVTRLAFQLADQGSCFQRQNRSGMLSCFSALYRVTRNRALRFAPGRTRRRQYTWLQEASRVALEGVSCT